jgi:alanyl-tRNA synthetase
MEVLLSELSRLAGILNIDVGTDVEELYRNLSERLSENGISISLDDLKKVTEPLSSIYAIPDHMHAICNMLGDGLVPSNSKAGYLVRMLARRVCRMKDALSIPVSLSQLGAHHIQTHLDIGGFVQSEDGILKILELEEARYHEMLRKGRAAVNTALKGTPQGSKQINDEILFRLSEERGLNPDMVVSIAKELGWPNLEVRVGFTADMAARNALMTKNASKSKDRGFVFDTSGIEITQLDYYDDTEALEFQAEVLHCFTLTDDMISELTFSGEVESMPTHAIVTDRTLFYPEGGGQLGDQGKFSQDGREFLVLDTKSQEGVVLHFTGNPLKQGKVMGTLNRNRRKQLMDHHTAVHIVGGAARHILGPHVWQAGSNKGARYARLDITHYSRLTRKEIEAIEDLANNIIDSNLKIKKEVLDRSDADSKYGFDIYQGGPPKHSRIRVISIGDFDVQACGGTHHEQVSSIGELRILKSSQVQDGVERLQIVAGETSRDNSRRQERILSEASEVLGVQSEDLPKAVSRFFEEWKVQQKKIESLEAEIVRLRTTGGGDDSTVVDGVRYVIMEVEGEMKQMMTMLSQLTRDTERPTLAVLGTRIGGGKLIVACTEDSIASERHNAIEILNEISGHIGGGGGGRPTMAQGGGTNGEGIPNALKAANTHLGL